ncbi:MAG: hypothetical protein AW07_04550 [Candidatus Accumulibacter sp. SK-11]|nr:MAG: hypothetical protein AW07_04550 [Candidatus Accumulibacter sp. SK-11]
MRLDRIRQPPTQAGVGTLLVAAELQHQPALRGVDDVEAARQPDDDDERQQQTDAAAEKARIELHRRPVAAAVTTAIATTAAALAVENPRQATIEVAPQLLEVRRPLVGTTTAAIITAAVAPLRVIQRHQHTKARNHGEPSESRCQSTSCRTAALEEPRRVPPVFSRAISASAPRSRGRP